MTWWSLTDLLITWWILITLGCFWYCLKGLLKGFWWPFRSSKSVKYSWSYGPNKVYDITSPQALLRSYLIFGKLWRYSCSFSPVLCRFSSGSHVSFPWLYPFHLTRNLFFLYLCHESRIFFTSHSSWPYIKVGDGGVDFCLWMVDLEYYANLLV